VIISRFSSDGIEVWLRKIGLIMVMAWCVLGCREANVDPDNGQGAMVEMTTRWDESRGLSGPWVRALAINTPTQFYGVVVQGQTVTGIASITDGTVKMLATPDPDAVTALMLDSNKSLCAGTSTGLSRLDRLGWTRLGEDPVDGMVASDTVVWVWGQRSGQIWVGKVVDGLVKVLPTAQCRDLVALIPAEIPTMVCRTSVLVEGDDGFEALSTSDSPLQAVEIPDVEGSPPGVWLYDGALGPAGKVYVVGRMGHIVSLSTAGMETVADGHFVAVIADEAGVFGISQDQLIRWTPQTGLNVVIGEAQGTIAHPLLDDQGNLFVIRQPKNQPHRVERWPSPYTNADRIWSLAFESSLSPGVTEMRSDTAGGVVLATNRGLWHLN